MSSSESRISIDGYEPAHLSYSALNGYRMCPKQYQLGRVLGLEEKPGLAGVGGNGVHTATEWLDLADFFGVPLSEVVTSEIDND